MSTLEIILVVIGLELIALAFLLVATVVTQSRKSGGKIQRLRSLWSSLLPAALAGDPEATSGIRASLRSKASFEAFHSLIDEQLRRERGRSTLALRRLSRAVDFTERLHRELLQSRRPLERAAAAKTLGRLRERIAEETAMALLRSDDPAVVLAAAYATASFRDPKRFLPVFRAVYDRTPITLHGAAELLSGFEEGVCPAIHRLLIGVASQYGHAPGSGPADLIDREQEVDRSETAVQVVMVDLLAFYGYLPAASTLLRLLKSSEDEEVLIHLAKAIAKVGNASAVPRLTELLTHPNWVIRSQSAQALAALGAVEAATSVRALLDDESLAVRADAQRALSSMAAMHEAGEREVLGAFA